MKRILIIDDEEDNLIVFKLLFKMLNKKHGVEFDVHFIKWTNNESYNEIFNVNPDILFLDIKLPGTSGVDVLKKLREDGFDKPVIAQTSHATTLELPVYESIFSEGLIKKPIEEDVLLEILKKYNFVPS